MTTNTITEDDINDMAIMLRNLDAGLAGDPEAEAAHNAAADRLQSRNPKPDPLERVLATIPNAR